MSEEHRLKIKNSNILTALIDHAEGKREMTASQASTGLGLLKKVMPDLAQTTVVGDSDADPVNVLTKIERKIVDPANSNG